MSFLSSLTRAALGGCALAVFLVACGNSQPSGLAPSTASNDAIVGSHLSPALAAKSAAVVAPAVGNHRIVKRWVAPDIARAPRLLFASDSGTNSVYIFTLPGLTLKATIPGFDEPQGMCADNRTGDIWVTNTGTAQVILLSRTGTVLKTVDDSSGYPVGCAVNPANGDLAVFNIFGFSGSGEVLVYAGGSGTPTPQTITNFYYYYFGGYDNSGNLFADGRNSSGDLTLGEIPSGSNTGHVITITGGTIYFPGFVQWYAPGDYVAVADQLCGDTEASCIYWITIAGSTGTITGKTTLENYEGGQICDLVQGTIAGHQQKFLAGSDYEYCGYASGAVNRWLYPAGGLPTNYNDSFGAEIPIGAAVSTK